MGATRNSDLTRAFRRASWHAAFRFLRATTVAPVAKAFCSAITCNKTEYARIRETACEVCKCHRNEVKVLEMKGAIMACVCLVTCAVRI